MFSFVIESYKAHSLPEKEFIHRMLFFLSPTAPLSHYLSLLSDREH